MTEPIKLCCDCKYYRKNWYSHLCGDPWDFCTHPKVTGDVVNGNNRIYCKTARNHTCDYEGKYFEERK